MPLEAIQNKDCTKCKFGTESGNVCQIKTEFTPNGDMLMVVGDFPAKSDSSNDTVFQSGKESFFWEIALGCIEGSKRWQFYPTYAAKCRTVKADSPGKQEIAACREYLDAEIKLLKPKAILLLGSIPMLSFGIKTAITKARGSIIEYEIDGFKTKLIPTYAPMYVVNNRSVLESFARDINKAYTLATGTHKEVEETKVVLVETIEGVEEVINYCLQTKEVCVDFETTEIEELGTFAPDFKATLVSLSFQHGSSYAIPLEHFESPFTRQEVLQIMGLLSKHLFQNPDIRKINHNIKYEMHVSAHYGFPLWRGRIDDTMLMHHLLDADESHKLKDILPNYYPEREGYQNEVAKYPWAEVPLKILAPYGAVDTDLTFRLCTILEAELLKDPRSYVIYRNQVIPALRPLFRAERRGMRISRATIMANIKRATFLKGEQTKVLLAYPQIKKFEAAERIRQIKAALTELEVEMEEKVTAANLKITERIKTMESKTETKIGKALEKHLTLINVVKDTRKEKLDEIRSKYRDKINAVKTGQVSVYDGVDVSNANHIAEFMYSRDGLGYPLFYVRSERKHKKTTDQRYIKRYNDHSGFIKDLLVLRSINTNINTFMNGMLEHLDKNDFVHTTFAQHGTGTGRLSCVGVDTLIKTDRGLVRIGDLIPANKGEVKLDGSLQAKTHKGRYKPITHAINKGYEEMYRVELESGKVIECTMQHKFYTNKGWYTLKQILSSSSIKKVTPLGKRLVADITVAGDNSYIGNGIVSHNSKKPNLQQTPKHAKVKNPYVEEVVGMIARAFVVPEGYTILSGDFSQAELRIIAELAGETAMIKAYNNGIDLHALTASIVLGKTLEEFYQMPEKERKDWRQKAKACNFGLIYGQEPLGFMEYAEAQYGVKMTLAEATEISRKFFAAYPKLLEYHANYKLKAKKYGYVRSLLGRKRHLKNINHADEFVRGEDERAAINHPVQATCGEMTILAFALLEHRLPKSVLFVNTVHDNIIYYCPNHLVPYASKIMRDTAENLPTKFLFGRELEQLKLVMDVEASTTNLKELVPYSEADWKEFITKEDIESYYAFIEEKNKKAAQKIFA